MMATRCPAAVDTSIRPNRGLEALMPEKLFDGFEASGFGIKDHLRTQVPKLMWGEHNAAASMQVTRDQPCHGHLALWRAVDIHEQPCGAVADDLRREAVAILDQHF